MSEIVVYTTIAVVFSRHDDVDDDDESDDRDSVHGGGVLWRPIADGAWTQVHLVLEMERDVCAGRGESPRQQLMRNFRLIAWVLETGKVIVNDVVSAKCMWAPIDELLWQFTSAEGQCYGFRFHSMEQADECAHVLGGILNNVDELRHLVKKMFQTRTTTRDFLALLYDIGFFKLDSDRRSTMIESAHAAVASLQAQSEWPRTRPVTRSLYPKETVPNRETLEMSRSSTASTAQTQQEAESSQAGIIMACAGKRSSNHPLLAQFSEVQLAALAATESTEPPQMIGIEETTHNEGDSDTDDRQHEDGNNPTRAPTDTVDNPANSKILFESSTGSTSSLQDTRVIPMSAPKDCISMPYKTRQELHVTYNNDLARYEGLPWAWRRLNHQFGLPLEAVPKRDVPGYPCKIPAVLQMLKESLIANDGLLAEGIFRVAPDKDQCAAVKQSLNDGTYSGCADVHILANLIKVWFRELPQSLFNSVPEKLIYQTCELQDPAAVLRSIDAFPPLHGSLVSWLLDLMAAVAANEKHNKMTARNMAIVISPNLFSIESDNPMYALTMSQKVAQFTFVLLDAWLSNGKR